MLLDRNIQNIIYTGFFCAFFIFMFVLYTLSASLSAGVVINEWLEILTWKHKFDGKGPTF